MRRGERSHFDDPYWIRQDGRDGAFTEKEKEREKKS